MGFFSWDCKSCGHPMICPNAVNEDGINKWMTKVVVMASNGSRLIGNYDGYGRVDDRDIVEFDRNEPCCYHQACWESEGRPEYDGPSLSSLDQGWFFDDADHSVPEPASVQ